MRIKESKEFKATVDKLIKKARAATAISTSSWEGQFLDAIRVPDLDTTDEQGEEGDGGAEDDGAVQVERPKSPLSYVMHYLTLFWKLIFAAIPPPDYVDGWACFVVSIIFIGLLTAVIGDLASHFGCTIGLKDSVCVTVSLFACCNVSSSVIY